MMGQPKFDIVDYFNERLGISKIRHPGIITKMIERNGLLIISVATALLYWYFDSLHTYRVYARIYTAFLFVCYGFFTQYLINRYKTMESELKGLRQELKQQTAAFPDGINEVGPA